MEIDILRGELERLFELEELLELSRTVLALDPEAVGGTAGKGSFVRALTEVCGEREALEALCDVVVAAKPGADPRLTELARGGLGSDQGISLGDELDGFMVVRRLGEGPVGTSYAARKAGGDYRLKVLDRAATRDRRALERFLMLTRLASGTAHPSLPTEVATGQVGGRVYVAHRYVEAQPLSARIARTGPMHINEARPLLHAIVEPLAALHEQRIAHGDLKLENVLVSRDAEGKQHVLLVDACTDRLRAVARANGHAELLTLISPKTVAPEQLRGESATRASDIYSFGALLYELLTGKPPFATGSALDTALAHLGSAPRPPSAVAPRGWINRDLDELVLELLHKDPTQRLPNIAAVFARLDTPGTQPVSQGPTFSEDDLDARIDALILEPESGEAADALEQAVRLGGNARRVADAFMMAASQIVAAAPATTQPGAATTTEAPSTVAASLAGDDDGWDEAAEGDATAQPDASAAPATEAPIAAPDASAPAGEMGEDGTPELSTSEEETELPELNPEQKALKKGLLFRAALLYQDNIQDYEAAERAYLQITALDPEDSVATGRLEATRKQLGKFDEIVEGLLADAEAAEGPEARAQVMAQIGRLYAVDMQDREQGLVAYTQAFCDDPKQRAYAEEIERLAADDQRAWGEVLSTCTEASTQELPFEVKNPLFAAMGRWYGDKYNRPDLSLTCFNAILSTEPKHSEALEGLCSLYRKTQQWGELGRVLMQRADAAATPAAARDLRCEAAELLAMRLGDVAGARDMYLQVLAEDPGHLQAAEAVARLYEHIGDNAGLVRVLEHQAAALRGAPRLKALCRIAEVHELRLGDDVSAVKHYESVLADQPSHAEALRGLDRLYSKAGRFKELLSNLEAQVAYATTPKQKLALLERIAALSDEEFLDHAKAAASLEAILEIDPGRDAAMTSLARHYRVLDRWQDLEHLYERHLALVTTDAQKLQLSLARARVLAEHHMDAEKAIVAYEAVLEVDPAHAGALESLARLRESAGHGDAALEAIETLAEQAETPAAKAEQYLRAAKLLAGRGDRDGAIEHYKLALDATPKDATLSATLRAALVERGDANAAVELIERELAQTDGDRAKARLAAEMATLQLEKLEDEDRAERSAKRALDYDPTNTTALIVLGDLAFSKERFVEAAAFYEKLASRADALDHDDAVRVLVRFVDALSKGGSTEKAVAPMDTLLRLAPNDQAALLRVAQVTFEHGSPKRSKELHTDLLERFSEVLTNEQKAGVAYRLGESLRRLGELDPAVRYLDEAADLDPSSALPVIALAEAHLAKGEWEEVIRAKTRHLDIAEGDTRVKLLMEIGEIASERLKDRNRAAKSFAAAVEERPEDRKLLMRLMQLYSEDKDWGKLVEVVLKLADFVDDNRQKSKYVQTAAMVTGREMGDLAGALEFYAQARRLDPTNERAYDETIALLEEKERYEDALMLLHEAATLSSGTHNTPRLLTLFTKIAEISRDRLHKVGQAVEALEAARTLDPDNEARNDQLAELYATNSEKYLQRATTLHMSILRQNPYRVASYKHLRRMYTDAKRADPAWCLCQALYVLQLAEEDEERFFRRMRSEDPAYAQDVITEDDWSQVLQHESLDPRLTAIFTIIEPAIIASRGQPLAAIGFDPRYALDLTQHPYPMSQTLHYAAGVMGMDCPLTFENANDPAGLAFLHAQPPSIVLGGAALTRDIPPQAAAFIAGRHLSYFRPGFYLRHLLSTGTGLKSWLFGAIKMNAPGFPVAGDIVGPVQQAEAVLRAGLSQDARDKLQRAVSKLLQEAGSLDLKSWYNGVDLTADRMGFVLAHDLETAVEIVRASEESTTGMTTQQRLKELVLFAISEPYFGLRQRLQIGIGV